MEEFVKFPRTAHLFSAGGNIPRDDLLFSDKTRNLFFTSHVTVEEKIDGSNLGFSLDPSTLKILAQNRSHHVTSQSHSQFKLLDQWIQDHPKLYDVLQPHYILYGEWMYAQHSVFYDKLPGYFIAFDIFDKQAKQFLSVAERNKRLQGTGIPIVHTVATGVFKNEESYMQLLDLSTAYCKHLSNNATIQKKKNN